MTQRSAKARHFESIEETVELGANSAEEITKSVASLPLRMLEQAGLFGAAGAEVRRVQDGVIGAVYDTVREVNRRVCELARDVRAEVGADPSDESPPGAARTRSASTRRAPAA